MSMESPVVFENKQGHRLFGILHEPPAQAMNNGVAIILLSPGVKMRVAPHRMYKVMAERYASMGFYVLRFDFYGLGDSEGEIQDTYLADLYGNVQVGCYIGDTLASMDWMQDKYEIDRFVLGGLCGGAITGLLAAKDDIRVTGLLGIGIPVILDSQNIDRSKFISKGQSDRLRKGYIKKLLSPKAWMRLLSFRSDFSVILKIFSQMLPSMKGAGKVESVSQAQAEKDNFNTHFPPAFFSMVESGRNVLFIFSGADRLHWEYEEKFCQRYKERIPEPGSVFNVHVINEANHILSSDGSMRQMLDLTSDWLSMNYAN